MIEHNYTNIRSQLGWGRISKSPQPLKYSCVACKAFRLTSFLFIAIKIYGDMVYLTILPKKVHNKGENCVPQEPGRCPNAPEFSHLFYLNESYRFFILYILEIFFLNIHY